MRNEKMLGEYKGGSSCEPCPQGPRESTYRVGSLAAHSFHVMAQMPGHKSFTSPTTEALPGPENLSHKGPHSSFLHSVPEM